jgi:hypothetical protein
MRSIRAGAVGVAACALVGAIAGCSLPRGVTGDGLDAAIDANGTMPDIGPRPDGGMDEDAFTTVDAWTMPGDDAWTMPSDDAWIAPIDAYVAPVDAWMPPPDDAWSPPDCTATFMPTSTNFELCSSDTTSCTFYLQLGTGTSCDDVCGRTGHTCLAEIDNNATSHCTSAGGAQTCGHNLGDGICTCSWP